MAKLTVNQLDNLKGVRVLARVDYNVPLEETADGIVINDDTRIRATLPTLRLLQGKGAKIVLCAHLGRPKGNVDAALSLKPVAAKLGELIGGTVAFASDCVGPEAEKVVAGLQDGEIALLENLRFHAEEEANDLNFARQLASLGDVYVNDAFGAAHRAHASTAGVAQIITEERSGRCAAGLLMELELRFLGDELDAPEAPFVVILGGAKVSDKILVIEKLLEKANTVIIGGAMAYTFRLALGHTVGKSLVEKDKVEVARSVLEKAKAKGVTLLLPEDNTIATPYETGELNKKGKPKLAFKDVVVNDSLDIPDHAEGLDIGPKSIEAFSKAIAQAKTILWNGPMGMFEDERFAAGSVGVGQAIVDATAGGAKSIIGGGDSVKALNKAGLTDKITFASTGGGASLEFLEGKTLPGVEALTEV